MKTRNTIELPPPPLLIPPPRAVQLLRGETDGTGCTGDGNRPDAGGEKIPKREEKGKGEKYRT